MYSVIDVWYHKDIGGWVDVLVAPVSSAFTLVHRVNPCISSVRGGAWSRVCVAACL